MYYYFNISAEPSARKENKMDCREYGAQFYKTEIENLISETNDLSLLDLIYKILLQAKK